MLGGFDSHTPPPPDRQAQVFLGLPFFFRVGVRPVVWERMREIEGLAKVPFLHTADLRTDVLEATSWN